MIRLSNKGEAVKQSMWSGFYKPRGWDDARTDCRCIRRSEISEATTRVRDRLDSIQRMLKGCNAEFPDSRGLNSVNWPLLAHVFVAVGSTSVWSRAKKISQPCNGSLCGTASWLASLVAAFRLGVCFCVLRSLADIVHDNPTPLISIPHRRAAVSMSNAAAAACNPLQP
jgi:hypothetical protein